MLLQKSATQLQICKHGLTTKMRFLIGIISAVVESITFGREWNTSAVITGEMSNIVTRWVR